VGLPIRRSDSGRGGRCAGLLIRQSDGGKGGRCVGMIRQSG